MGAKKRKRKSVDIGPGGKCSRCHKQMRRIEHGPTWKPKQNQPYYFTYWDKCSCSMIQLYEKAKVWLKEPPKDELVEEFKAIIGGQNG